MKRRSSLAATLIICGTIFVLAALGLAFYLVHANYAEDYWNPVIGDATALMWAQFFLGAILCGLGVWLGVSDRKRRGNVHQGNATD